MHYCVSVTRIEKDDENETIGQRVAKYRKLARMSAQKLADLAGLTRSVVTNIENGRRDDLAVSELIRISSALRVPPVAIVFPIDKPFTPSPLADSEDGGGFPPRTIDLIDWFGGVDSGKIPSALRSFNDALAELDAVVVYPIGLTVESSESIAGRAAQSMINAARLLDSAQVFFEEARRKVLLFARDAWPDQNSDEFEQLDAALDAGSAAGTVVGEKFLGMVRDSDRIAVASLLRESDAAARNVRDARDQFERLGGSTKTGFAMSPLQIMQIVQSMPHEPYSVTVARGELADGIVESPLRLYRADEFADLRRSLNLPPIPENG